MTEAATPQHRLAKAVRERRIELGLSVREASKRAAMSRNTWQALEEGTRATRDHNYAGIEQALEWPPGRVLAILESDAAAPEPTADEIIAMTAQQISDYYVDLARRQGKVEAEDWLYRAVLLRREARRTERGTVPADRA